MSEESLDRHVRSLAKAELHLHIEGTLEPELLFDLAGRNKISLPHDNPESLRRAYNFEDLQSFLDLYYTGVDVLRNPRDFEQLANEYFLHARADNVNHVELFFDPQAHTDRGIALATVMEGLEAACESARQSGIRVGMIACFLRHLPEASALRTLEALEPYRHRLLGVGLDSSELGHPPAKFKTVFDAARKQGYKLVAHAGEEGPPEYVWEALDVLGVDRIDHGNRALEDKALISRLRRDQIALTVCPLSNLRLCVVDNLNAHPLKTMLDENLLVTVNSDDPAYFGGYINDNFVRVGEALNLTHEEITRLAENSFKATLLD